MTFRPMAAAARLVSVRLVQTTITTENDTFSAIGGVVRVPMTVY